MSSFAGGIRAVEPERVGLEVDQADVRPAERPVRPGIVDVPGELLGGDPNDQRLALRRHAVDARRPERDREREQENRFDHGDANLRIARSVRLDAGVVRHRVARSAEAEQDVGEERSPADEQDQHEHVHPADQAVDLRAVSRGERRESEPFSHDVLGDLWSFDHSVVELDVREALGAPAQIEKEAREPALHRQRDGQHHQRRRASCRRSSTSLPRRSTPGRREASNRRQSRRLRRWRPAGSSPVRRLIAASSSCAGTTSRRRAARPTAANAAIAASSGPHPVPRP